MQNCIVVDVKKEKNSPFKMSGDGCHFNGHRQILVGHCPMIKGLRKHAQIEHKLFVSSYLTHLHNDQTRERDICKQDLVATGQITLLTIYCPTIITIVIDNVGTYVYSRMQRFSSHAF